jgi:hypothetical protein
LKNQILACMHPHRLIQSFQRTFGWPNFSPLCRRIPMTRRSWSGCEDRYYYLVILIKFFFSPIFWLSDAWINQSIKPPFPKMQQREGKKNNESSENDLKMRTI